MTLACSLGACPADTRSALVVWVSDLGTKASNAVLRVGERMRRYDGASCLAQKLYYSSPELLAPVRSVRELFERLGCTPVLATMRLRLFWTNYTAVCSLHYKLALPHCTCSWQATALMIQR